MKDLLLYMAKSLVDDPDSVTVTEVEGETTVVDLTTPRALPTRARGFLYLHAPNAFPWRKVPRRGG